MRFRLPVVVAAALLIAADAPRSDVKDEMKKMEGVWRLVSVIADGKPWPDDRVKAITIAVKADGTWVEDDGKETFEATFTIDPAQSPRTATFVNTSGKMKGVTCLEIDKIEGDTMTMCFVSVPTGKESTRARPSKFASEPGSGRYLCVMKRENNPPDPARIVQEQVEACNRHDLEAFLKTYSTDVKRYTYPDQEIGVGLESMRKTYGKIFAENPKLNVKIAQRIVQGEYVIDHEHVDTGTRAFTAVAVYRVKDGKILEVRFLK